MNSRFWPGKTSMSPETQFAQSLASLKAPSPLDYRKQVTELIKTCLQETRELAETQLLKDGHGTACAQRLSAAEDAIIQATFSFAQSKVFKARANGLAIVAVGGYGRGTLAP